MKCHKCDGAINPTWRMCPMCGSPVHRACRACDATLDPAWQLCPMCGTSVGTPDLPQALSNVVRADQLATKALVVPSADEEHERVSRLWPERIRLVNTYERCFAPLRAELEGATDTPSFLRAREPARIRSLIIAAIDALKRCAGDANYPAWFRDALAATPSTDAIVSRIDSSLAALREAAEFVKSLNLPTTALGKVFATANSVLARGSDANNYAATGFSFGNAIIPGLGILGGAAGAFAAQAEKDAHTAAALKKVDDAFLDVSNGVDAIFDVFWDSIGIVGKGAKQPSSFYRTAAAKFADISSRGEGHPSALTYLEREARELLRTYGPLPEAIHTLTRVLLTSQPNAPGAAFDVSSEGLRFFGRELPGLIEDAADAALAVGDFEQAEAIAREGALAHPDFLGLQHSLLDVLGAKGRLDEARALEARCRADDSDVMPSSSVARGILRNGSAAAAAGYLAASIEANPLPFLAMLSLGRQEHLADIFLVHAILPTLDFVGSFRAVAEKYLLPNNASSMWRHPPEAVLRTASQWLETEEDEDLLFFVNWSVWSAGATGLAVTTKSLRWKCVLGAPVRVDVAALVFEPPSLESDRTVKLCDHAVDVESDELASGLVLAFAELGDLLTPGNAAVAQTLHDEASRAWHESMIRLATARAVTLAMRVGLPESFVHERIALAYQSGFALSCNTDSGRAAFVLAASDQFLSAIGVTVPDNMRY